MILYQQLKYLITSIEKGDYDATELVVKLDELIADVQKVKFRYQSKTILGGLNAHMKTYTFHAKRNKAKALATLEDVRGEMSKDKPNSKTMLSQLNLIKRTNFFVDKLQEKMLLDRTFHSSNVIQNELLEVI